MSLKNKKMEINGYSVLVEKGKWVDDKILYHSEFTSPVLERLEHLVQNPNYPRYIQHAPIEKIKRIRLDPMALYAKIYPTQKIITILALLAHGAVKNNEKTGSLSHPFFNYLFSHNDGLLKERFRPYGDREGEERSADPEKESSWAQSYDFSELKELSEEEAILLLDKARPKHGIGAAPARDPFCENVVSLVNRDPLWDRLLVPIPETCDPLKKEDVRALRVRLMKFLDKATDKPITVSYDEMSQKFLVVPTEKSGIYCRRQYYRRRPKD